jgi:outer membrane protein insertion porin family
LSHSKQFLFTGGRDVDRSQSFNITSLSVGVAKRLTVPDDYFTLSNSVSFQYYDLNNYNTGLFTFGNGASRNLAFTTAISRNNKGTNPIYPMYGSEFTISAKFTLPYSLMNGIDYGNLQNLDENKLTNTNAGYFGVDGVFVAPGEFIKQVTVLNSFGQPETGFVKANNAQEAAVDQGKVDQQKFNWLEYYKIKFKADWYTKIWDKLVLRSLGEFGFLGAYNSDRGLVPFERFYLGGDGLANFALDGREIIQLRGYPNQSLSSLDGGTIYNKFSLELRYPLTLKGQTTIYALGFLEAGAAFGLLGIDFGHGFDALPGGTIKNGWETHFIIGQQF